MRKLKLAMYVSVDGVVEKPAWTGPFWNDQLSQLQERLSVHKRRPAPGTRHLDGFAVAWPTMEESTGEFGKKMNAMPKFVASRTLDTAEWNATIIKGDLVGEVTTQGSTGRRPADLRQRRRRR